MRMRRLLYLTIGTVGLAAAPVRAQEHSHGQAPGDVIGDVVFPTSCAAPAHAEFTRGVTLLHSFWYEEAEAAFRSALARDSRCAIALWGVAMSRFHPLWQAPIRADLDTALAALDQAAAIVVGSRRENDYLEAIGAFYRDHERASHAERMGRYEDAARRLREKYPDDVEAAIFYALALVANAPPADATLQRQKRAGEILEPLFARHPGHPGLAHYVIHAYDSPALADRAVDAARRYADIAPAVPHARHMPSHIFTRLGMWPESIRSNHSAAVAGACYETRQGTGITWGQRLHAMDYLAYAHLQLGNLDAARAVTLDARRVANVEPAISMAADYSLAAIPARWALERSAWKEASTLAVRPAPSYRATEAITHFARGVGSARSGDPVKARREATAMEALAASLPAEQRYWTTIVEAQRHIVLAWATYAEGDMEQATVLGKRGADIEDGVDKSPVTPAPVQPARESYAEMLAGSGRHSEALAEFESVLRKEANRRRSLEGALAAARAIGDAGSAARLQTALDELQRAASDADVRRLVGTGACSAQP
jgi:tetratricopeptide (TPR) repeat protein